MRSQELLVSQLRDAITKTVRMMARDSIKVTQQGSDAYCRFDSKGKVISINIPVIPDNPTPQFLVALQGFLDHEVGHALDTDAKVHAKFDKSIDPKTAKEIDLVMNLVEDVRIERCMAKRFAGSEVNLDSLREFMVDEIWEKERERIEASDLSPIEKRQRTMSYAMVAWMRARGGQKIARRFMDKHDLWGMFEGLDAKFPDLEKRLANLTSSKDAMNLSKEIYEVVKRGMPPPPPEAGSDKSEDKEKDKSGKKDDKPDTKETGKGKPEESDEATESGKGEPDPDHKDDEPETKSETPDKSDKPEDDGEDDEADSDTTDGGSDDSDDEGDETEDAGSDDGDDGDDGDTSDAGGSDASDGGDGDESEGEERGSSVEEEPTPIDWDSFKDTDEALKDALKGMMSGAFDTSGQIHFTRDYDRVEPYKAPASVDVREIEDNVRKIASPLQSEIARLLKARSQSYFTPGYRSGRLNAPSLHRLQAHDDRIFKRRHIAETKDVAVSLVVDLSGSMRGRKIKTAIESAWAFSETLDRLGIKNEVIGFTSCGLPSHVSDAEYNHSVRQFADDIGVNKSQVRQLPFWMPIFKGFEERFTAETKRRLAHMHQIQPGMADNNDALAVEYAMERISRRPEVRKIIIVLSDGSPSDRGLDYRALNSSTREAVKKVERQKIEILGIGIEDASVKQFYAKHHVINRSDELPKFVTGQLKQLLLQ